ncbi:DUF1684 domain-containing protein [Gryllotalpicola protaetiae]|uniref:DUF1684 domain-containing protein n=1 Tax=Gryllotalpicola protaetiae TaxID=2419771 RepID=A0A387BW47_9MICO|nr:DUF1684 domain-containing protein [Gryllotalpicola protaetiae]AYG05057.1 DUF1684 domain-containing protein [Gryllotalpicola protaetiae]
MTDLTPAERLATFRSRREQSVKQPQGSLALVNTQWITGDPEGAQTVYGVAGTYYPLPAGEKGLRLVATAADGIRVDDEPVDGELIISAKDGERPSAIVFDDHTTGTVIVNEAGTEYALRVWDAKSEDLENFGGIDAYGYDPEWVITAKFTPVEGLSVGFEHIKDEGEERETAIPGEITFEKDGVAYNLAAFKSGRALQLVFADATNDVETYSVGRFLFVAPNPDGTITLDFNLAILPPCAFSYQFNCPLPPKQNRFTVPIRAGEKNALNKAGELLHAF